MTLVAMLLLGMVALPAHAADSATFTVTPTSVTGGSTVDFTFTFTSDLAALSGNPSALAFEVDAALPAFTANPAAPGAVALATNTCNSLAGVVDGATPRLVTWSLRCGKGESFSFTYRNVPIPATGSAPANLFTATLNGPPGITITFNPAITVTVGDAPDPPALDSATAGDTTVDLAWTAAGGGAAATGYQVQRAAAVAGPFTDVGAALAANVLTFTDTGLTNGTEYFYRVRAVNAFGTADSNVRSATPVAPPAAPDAPNLLTAAAGNGQVVLTWAAPTTGGPVATYRVERSPAGVGAWATLQSNLTTLTHTDATAVNGTAYDYRVVAVNITGEQPSNVRSATPQAPFVPGGGNDPIVPPITPPITPPAPGRCVDEAPTSDFVDVADGHIHERAIDCIAWKGITTGTGPRTYSPGRITTRGQMASFLARTIREAGGALPAGRDRFVDDGRSVHSAAIRQLAAAGIVQGKTATRYVPDAPVRRDQMATMLVNTYAYLSQEQLRATRDVFRDDNGNVHEATINAAAEKGLVLGRSTDRYAPAAGTRRDQMASFLTRLLEVLGG